MSDLNIIIADNDQLSEIYTALKHRVQMLQAYNQLYMASKESDSKETEGSLSKEIDEAQKELINHLEIVTTLLKSIES